MAEEILRGDVEPPKDSKPLYDTIKLAESRDPY